MGGAGYGEEGWRVEAGDDGGMMGGVGGCGWVVWCGGFMRGLVVG